MKHLIGVIVIIALVITGLNLSCEREPSPPPTPPKPPEPTEVMPVHPTPIRLVYPTNSLITGHLGEVLNHTNILEKNKLIGEFRRMESDDQIISSLISQQFDAAFLSDIACTLALARDFNGLVLTNLGALGRNALMVPPESSIQTIKDLENTTVGVTFGSPAHHHLLNWLRRESLEAGRNITLVNLSPTELLPAIQQGTVRAIALTDPLVQQLMREHNFENRADTLSYGVAMISKDYWQKNPKAVYAFIRSLKEAFYFMAHHKDEADQWFGNISKIAPELIRACANINLSYNLRGKINNVRIGVTDNFLRRILADCVRFNHEAGLAPKLIDVTSYVEPELIEESKREIDPLRYDPNQVKIIK